MKNTSFGLLSLIAVLSGTTLWANQLRAVADPDSANATKLCDQCELDPQPKPIKRTLPFYLDELKASRKSGEVVLSFVVDVDGSVKNLSIEKATDNAFGEAAIAVVATWKFEPGVKNCAPVSCRLCVPLRFTLAN